MRWKKIATLTLALAAALFAGLFGIPAWRWFQVELARRAEAPDPIVATADETRAILTAVLAYTSYTGVPPPPPLPGAPPREEWPSTLMLSDRSLCFYRKTPRGRCGDGDDLILFHELEEIAPLKLRSELVIANPQARPLSLDGIPDTRMVAAGDIDRVFDGAGSWEAFYRQFGKSAGLRRITRPVLTSDRKQALIMVSHGCDGLCGSVTLFSLHRTERRWQVSKDFVLSVR